jgi:hypothetical protein
MNEPSKTIIGTYDGGIEQDGQTSTSNQYILARKILSDDFEKLVYRLTAHKS